MALGALIPFAAQGVKTLADYFGRKKQPSFASSAQAKRLAQIGREGAYSPTVRSDLLARQSGTLGNMANMRKTSLRGQLEANGMGNSIAGLSLLNSVDAGVQKSLGDYMRELDIANEQSKQDALNQRATLADQHRMAKYADSVQTRQNLTGGLANAVAGFANYYGSQIQVPDDFVSMAPQDRFEWAKNNGIPFEDAETLYWNILGEQEPVEGYHGSGVTAPQQTLGSMARQPNAFAAPDDKWGLWTRSKLRGGH